MQIIRRNFQLIIWFVGIFVVAFFIWMSFLGISSFSKSRQKLISPINETSIELPRTLIIPRLNIYASVESVGLDSVGRMDVPNGVDNVAWFSLGFKPGEKGNAVFAGHYDKPDGRSAVFYKLGVLEKGDIIEVIDSNNHKLEFIVSEVRVVKTSEFPLQEVFGEVDNRRVNLITCGGVWNVKNKEYSERIIVFTELRKV